MARHLKMFISSPCTKSSKGLKINSTLLGLIHDKWIFVMSHMSFRVNLHSIVCLNVKKLLAWSRCHIWSLSDNNVIRTHNHLVHKQTLNHLAKLAWNWAKWLSVHIETKWLWVRITLLSLNLQLIDTNFSALS